MHGPILTPNLASRIEVIRALRSEATAVRVDDPAMTLLEDAEWLSGLEPSTVTHKPEGIPRPTEDPRDYVSIGTYWWPNPDTEDGLPFVHRDGEFSPLIPQYDRPRWDLHSEGLVRMQLAQRVSGHDRFTDAISRWLYAWYVDPETSMNPHLRHAQMCPGIDTGRMVGCIDFTVRAAHFIDALVEILPEHPALADAVRGWWSKMYAWLGSHETRTWHENATNNIGVHYDGTLVRLALFVGDEATADRVLDAALDRRVDPQIDAEGRMPEELRRTRSFSYTLMNLAGFLDLACLAEARGRSLFDAKSQRGRSICAAVRWLWDFAASDADWPGEQIKGVHWDSLVRMWWCLPVGQRNAFPLELLAHRLHPDLCQDARLVVPDMLLHPFHHPVWRDHPEGFPVKT